MSFFLLFVGLAIFSAIAPHLWRLLALLMSAPAPLSEPCRGLVKVRGKVEGGPLMRESPLTQLPCLFFRFEVKFKRYSRGGIGTEDRPLTHVARDQQESEVWLSDGSGRVQVNLKKARLELFKSRHGSWNVKEEPPPHIIEYLARRHRFDVRAALQNGALVYTETVVREGDELLVVGHMKEQAGGQ